MDINLLWEENKTLIVMAAIAIVWLILHFRSKKNKIEQKTVIEPGKLLDDRIKEKTINYEKTRSEAERTRLEAQREYEELNELIKRKNQI